MNEVTVLIPTLWKPHCKDAFKSLTNLPFQYRLVFADGGTSWAEAVNLGLRESKGDVLLMDDDIQILPGTFDGLADAYDKADIFGFKLLFPDGRIQHAGAFIRVEGFGHHKHGHPDDQDRRRYYMPHCTASLLYVKRHVLEALGGMKIFEGQQFEDVDFSMRALKAGFKIMYLPDAAIHHESQTKKTSPEFMDGFFKNMKIVHEIHDEFIKTLGGYPYEVQ